MCRYPFPPDHRTEQGRTVDLGLIPLALLMAAVTYPWRAVPLLLPQVNRVPPVVREYLKLVGPAMLATLAAVSVAVLVDASRTQRTFHFGIEWLAVALCVAVAAMRRSLLIGLVGAVLIVALARANGLAA
jgi:branched-subunit amino acid transport protein